MHRKLIAVFGFLALGTVPSFASVSPAVTFTGGNYASHGYEQTVGYEFQVSSQALDVGSLLWYAPTAGADSSQHQVGIWDVATSSIVAQACVGNGCAGSSYDATTDYWVTSISSAQLSANTQYVIGGYINPGDRIVDSANSISGSPLLTYQGELYSQPYGPNLTEPVYSYPPQAEGYIGPNLSVTISQSQVGSTATPEPAFYSLLGTGLAALGFFVRRRAA